MTTLYTPKGEKIVIARTINSPRGLLDAAKVCKYAQLSTRSVVVLVSPEPRFNAWAEAVIEVARAQTKDTSLVQHVAEVDNATTRYLLGDHPVYREAVAHLLVGEYGKIFRLSKDLAKLLTKHDEGKALTLGEWGDLAAEASKCGPFAARLKLTLAGLPDGCTHKSKHGRTIIIKHGQTLMTMPENDGEAALLAANVKSFSCYTASKAIGAVADVMALLGYPIQ